MPHADHSATPRCAPRPMPTRGRLPAAGRCLAAPHAPPRCPSCLEISADNTMNTKTDLQTRGIEAGRVGRVLGVLQTLC